jgi:hypothetical protein
MSFLSAIVIKEVVKGSGRMELCLLLLSGVLHLLAAEIPNGGDLSPLLSLAKAVAPRCGPVVTVASSTSRPTRQVGGLFALPLRRSSSRRCQVVLSPVSELVAAMSSASSTVEKDLIAFFFSSQGSFL